MLNMKRYYDDIIIIIIIIICIFCYPMPISNWIHLKTLSNAS
jgi:hypothetical protein